MSHPLLTTAILRASDMVCPTPAPQAGAIIQKGSISMTGPTVMCESSDDVNRAVSELLPGGEAEAILATTPEAAWRCLSRGLPYQKLEDFYDEAIFCGLSGPITALQMEWVERLDAGLLEGVPQFRESDFRPARMHSFFLKVRSDKLFMGTCALAHWFLAGRPERVLYFTAGAATAHEQRELLSDESVYQAILPACAAVYQIPLVGLAPDGSRKADRRPMRVRDRMRALLSPRQKACLRPLRSLGLGGLARRLVTTHTTPLLVFQHGYDVSVVARLALARGWRCREFTEILGAGPPRIPSSPTLVGGLSALWERLAGESWFRRPFQWLGVDLWPVAEPQLRYWWHHIIPQTWQAFTMGKERFARHRPAAVLARSPHEPVAEGVVHAGRTLGIPTFTYQHGGFEGSCECVMFEIADMRIADVRLVYGPGVEDYYRERLSRWPGPEGRVLSVGSARLDALKTPDAAAGSARLRRRLGVKPGRPMVLYVPTMYMRNRRYIACEDYGNVPYFELQARIVEVMREFPHIDFVYKAFPKPTPDPIIEMIAERCANCRVAHHPGLPDFLRAADLSIIDLPSTGLLEALLLSSKPIVVLADRRYICLRVGARSLLQKRAALAETPDEFIALVRQVLRDGRFAEVPHPNQEFLLAYGVHADDGNSAERVWRLLNDLVDTPAEGRADSR
jgi:hypothetical protein